MYTYICQSDNLTFFPKSEQADKRVRFLTYDVHVIWI